MAIVQDYTFTIGFMGDGTSTSHTIDLRKQIEALTILPVVPMVVLSVLPSGWTATGTATISGTQVTFTYTSAPPASNCSVQVNLGF